MLTRVNSNSIQSLQNRIDLIKKIIALRDKGYDYRTISKELKIDIGTISKILKENRGI